MFKVKDSDFSKPWYGHKVDGIAAPVIANEYVNEGGEIRIYFSYLNEIDGFHRTDVTHEFDVSATIAQKEDEYPFEGDYCYLYFNVSKENFFRPNPSKELEVFLNGDRYLRTCFITAIDDQALNLLTEYDAYRFADQIYLLSNGMENIVNAGGLGIVALKPMELINDAMVLEYHLVSDVNDPYDENLNGYLLTDDHSSAGSEYESFVEKTPTLTLQKK